MQIPCLTKTQVKGENFLLDLGEINKYVLKAPTYFSELRVQPIEFGSPKNLMNFTFKPNVYDFDHVISKSAKRESISEASCKSTFIKY